ncbi:MAG: sigma 54-interacting transcriptional regulator [Myxococcales bacterium]|nr:sigma 54-interacting transcriptional regulator [Myxococcales bacterium]
MSESNPEMTLTTPAWRPPQKAVTALFVLTRGCPHPVIPLLGQPLRFGRQPEGDGAIAFDDRRMSRTHAEVRYATHAAPTFHDLGSKNGSWHNGRAANGAVLDAGDVVRIGDTTLVVGAFEARQNTLDDGLLSGQALPLRRVREQIQLFAASELTILLLGETGTGKEVAARMIHERSGRCGPFVPVNCASIPTQLVERELFGHTKGAYTGAVTSAPGFVDAAEEGTLFLDEIGELPIEIQAKLLRFLQDRSFTPLGSTRARIANVRVVAATNRDLSRAVLDRTFRDDLFARLDEATIQLPPLRSRREDLVLLIDSLVTEGGQSPLALSPDALEAMALHDWPRNVRELKKLVRRLPYVTRGERPVDLDDLPLEIAERVFRRMEENDGSSGSGAPTPDELIQALRQSGGNVSQLAQLLGRDRKQIYRWLKRYQIDPDEYREG